MHFKLRRFCLYSWQVIKGFDKFEIREVSPRYSFYTVHEI